MGDLKMADFDVIVVGSGGWVAKEMCEKGFKVAVLERGRDIVPVEDYTDMVDPWDMEHLNQKSPSDYADYPVQSEVYAVTIRADAQSCGDVKAIVSLR